jgi:hypothetical protein
LPDLIRFWPAERRYELIEVKGPGDRLQDNQIRWLAYCAQHGMPVRVLDVRWADEAVVAEGGGVAEVATEAATEVAAEATGELIAKATAEPAKATTEVAAKATTEATA